MYVHCVRESCVVADRDRRVIVKIPKLNISPERCPDPSLAKMAKSLGATRTLHGTKSQLVSRGATLSHNALHTSAKGMDSSSTLRATMAIYTAGGHGMSLFQRRWNLVPHLTLCIAACTCCFFCEGAPTNPMVWAGGAFFSTTSSLPLLWQCTARNRWCALC